MAAEGKQCADALELDTQATFPSMLVTHLLDLNAIIAQLRDGPSH